MVEFRESDHTYWRLADAEGGYDPLSRTKLMGVSEAMGLVGMVDTTYFKEVHAVRGTFSHRATALLDQGTLDDSTVDETVGAYLDCYKEFLADCQPTWTRIEWLVACALTRCAGTIDRVGEITVRGEKQPVILDLKTGHATSTHPIQLAAYQHLVSAYLSRRGDPTGAVRLKRYALYLRKGKKYTLTPYSDPQDAAVWVSALTCANWIAEHQPRRVSAY